MTTNYSRKGKNSSVDEDIRLNCCLNGVLQTETEFSCLWYFFWSSISLLDVLFDVLLLIFIFLLSLDHSANSTPDNCKQH